MLIKFFKNGQGGGAGSVEYLIEHEVVAYDDNRNVLRDGNGNALMFEREPLPEVLRGDPDQMRYLIDACEHQWSYRAGVLSFTGEDAPTPPQQRSVMDSFEDLAFAGLEPDQRSILWVRHSHEDRIELHFVTPRMELMTGRSLNIAPPGYQKTYDSLRDVLNKDHGWNDPQAPERAREVKSLIESVRRGEGREQIHDWILNKIEMGSIQDRTEMKDALSKAGFEIPRSGKNYITVLDPESNERWRLKGEVFHENWTRQNTVERAIEQADREPSRSGSRLDAINIEELRDRLHDLTERRATYNRKRYPVALERVPTNEQEGLPDLLESNNSKLDRASNQFDSKLVFDRHDDHQCKKHEPEPIRVDDQSNSQWVGSELGQESHKVDRLSYWNRIRKMFAALGKGIIDDETKAFNDSTRTRIADIRRKIDRSISAIGNSVQGIGRKIASEDEGTPDINLKIAVISDRVTRLFGGGINRNHLQIEPEISERTGRKPERNTASTGRNKQDELVERNRQRDSTTDLDY
ncbi:MAG: relaxase/mobilization nuclease domain-containing protein [Lentilitoribacter sp.]